MKKIIILSAGLFLIAGIAEAQTADSTGHHRYGKEKMAMHHRHMGEMMSKLNLTDAQKQQLKTVNDNYRQQVTALQADNKLSLGDYKTKLASLRKDRKDQVSNVFTDEQKKMIADRENKMKSGREAHGEARLEKMKTALGLSDDQVAKIKTQREQLHTQAASIRQNSNLLPAEKRTQMKELFAQQKEQLKTVLTPDQLTKFESMRKEHMHGGHKGQAETK